MAPSIPAVPFAELPIEILLNVSTFLSTPRDLLRLAATNMRLRHALASETAAQRSRWSWVDRLLDCGALPSNTSLVCCSREGQLDLVKRILGFHQPFVSIDASDRRSGHVVDIHFRDDLALRQASLNGHSSIVELLVRCGAWIEAGNNEALRNACSAGWLETVRILAQAGADIHLDQDEPLLLAVESGNAALVEYLILHGADVNTQGSAALRAVCKDSLPEAVSLARLLIDSGVDIHAAEEDALCMAAMNGNVGLVQLLLRNGADPFVSDQMPLRLAAECNTHAGVVKLLLRQGCDVSVAAAASRNNEVKDIRSYLQRRQRQQGHSDYD
ncbi:ankyrin repeat-containing domain protein [Polychytrium aggregatum]|uniref:ankyrin repeat-containing domain protein n=1 Tax=Polychytrium aggregatum TaxID=110093 RepID=UPI0022FECC74|nr:ankyrin repeat-containing domain protein [Polychytrium aggregatum]KAI9202661.1 ankyrin repeat-containing domain protein [Polychytrium aggregatum]